MLNEAMFQLFSYSLNPKREREILAVLKNIGVKIGAPTSLPGIEWHGHAATFKDTPVEVAIIREQGYCKLELAFDNNNFYSKIIKDEDVIEIKEDEASMIALGMVKALYGKTGYAACIPMKMYDDKTWSRLAKERGDI